MQLRDLLERASRELLIEFVLAAIHGYTIMARDPDLTEDDRTMINNRIHYLVGHALSLSRREELDAWRFDGIVENFGPLAPSLQKHPWEVLKKLDPGSSPG
ncbi:hypothetical protein [uncultured Erythrobacter sp.]|uniref:hypothetical protein n=1 Tax=uncultured Erythrobacter sp. TaxID=263913 RepID=UPI0026123703|nr:hypothetical protein [uncultured Erythrobacter sp.]